MLSVLRHPTYARLFSAQVIALLGTGLLTVALGLLAFEIAGGDAGVVLGVAMTLKMVAYVVVSPVAAALTARLPRTPVLITADLVRAAVAVALPFVAEPWQIHLLILLLQSASATFTPAFQAVIPTVLPDEDEYTRALSLSRLAYDLESLVSPLLAAALLTVITFHSLFVGTVAGFLASAVLVALARIPRTEAPPVTPFLDRLTQGTRLFWARRELRGLLAHRTDRTVMMTGAAALPLLLAGFAAVLLWAEGAPQWVLLLVLWFLAGAATCAVLTPSARLLWRNSTEDQRPAVFAAQFSLSHACFLVTYPMAGLLGAALGLPLTAVLLAVLAALGLALAVLSWPSAGVPAQHRAAAAPPTMG